MNKSKNEQTPYKSVVTRAWDYLGNVQDREGMFNLK